jgi:hypothetical protein
MRFVEHGPNIPDELLTARDEGQVIFFCGSGVSLAKAGLPDFYGLADAVLEHLRASVNSRARAVIAASRLIKVNGVEGLIPADRAFSLLEQEFDTASVRKAVAASLVPKFDDLSAHRALIDLARGTDDVVRLVTTNFDRLFEACDPAIASHGPPELPNPTSSTRFSGIIHLHGRIDEQAAAPADDEFVLSSSDFGRAYLSDGWATRFIRTLMERYQIVFVGYTANDPPVQYLLEALNAKSAAFQPMYALQAGDDAFASAVWAHKGVRPISFDPADRYRALWDTIDVWAGRARDPLKWQSDQIARAAAGPRQMSPYERGTIAHLATSTAGAKQIAVAGAAFPAEWLCVFDPETRYRTPGAVSLEDDSIVFDPFAVWGLDTDSAPPAFDPKDRYKSREMPAVARNLFASTKADLLASDADRQAQLQGSLGQVVAPLAERVSYLGSWLVQVAHEPAALWWAAGKQGLHSGIVQALSRALEHEAARFSPSVRKGWRALLASFDDRSDAYGMEFYGLADIVKVEGWSPALIRRFAELRCPRIRVGRSWSRGAPPTEDRMGDILNLEIKYPASDVPLEVPADLLPTFMYELSHVLERAVALEIEARSSVYMLGPFMPASAPDDHNLSDVGDDLTGLFRLWIAMLDRLAATEPERVRAELPRWSQHEDAIFVRTRIWAAGAPGLLPGKDAAELVARIADEAFWEREHQRDLLHVLARRWPELPGPDRAALEARLLAGPPACQGETAEIFEIRSAYYAMERLHWLQAAGCAFGFDFDAEMARMRALVPEWSPRVGDEADDSTEARAYSIGEDLGFTSLLGIAVETIAQTALDQDHQRIEMRTIARPFRGLAQEKPVRALAALHQSSAKVSARLWEDFLLAEDRKPTSKRLVVATACVLAGLADEGLAEILRSSAAWVEKSQKGLAPSAPDLEARIWQRLIHVMELHPGKAGSGILLSGKEHDWAMEAINSPSGRLAQLAVHQSSDAAPDGGPLPQIWLDRLGQLIGLPYDIGRYSMVAALANINYLYFRAPDWTVEHLLSRRHGPGDDRSAFWSGLFRASSISVDLHRLLRADLLEAARETDGKRATTSPLAALLLRGWAVTPLRESGDAIGSDVLGELILEMNQELRDRLLRTCRTWWDNADWKPRALEFVRDVWPRQRAIRNPSTADAIASLMVGADDWFPQMFEAGRDLLESMPGMASIWSYDSPRLLSLLARFPSEFVDFLLLVLPEDAGNWPYRIEAVLEPLEASSLGKDSRVQELRRRWAAR